MLLVISVFVWLLFSEATVRDGDVKNAGGRVLICNTVVAYEGSTLMRSRKEEHRLRGAAWSVSGILDVVFSWGAW